MATLQQGRITTAQLERCGVTRSSISRWVAKGALHRVGRGVYAVGHLASGDAARLAEALLEAGSGAALSHGTAACWWGLLRYPPNEIHVCAPNRRRSRGWLRIHHPNSIDRQWHRGLPVTCVMQTLIQIAPASSDAALRRALAVADRDGRLDLPALRSELSARPRGAARLRHAIDHHMPELADTLSPLEDRFLMLCERHRIPLPVPNFKLGPYVIDAVWPEAGLAVELDGRDEHGSPAAVVRDRRRELAIRDAGLEVIRYGSEQIDRQSTATARDLLRALSLAYPRDP